MSEPLPGFRKDLTIVTRTRAGKTSYLVESPSAGDVMELGEEEFFLCRQLDGSVSSAEIARRYRARFAGDLPIGQIEALVRQLAYHEMLEVEGRKFRKRTFPEWLDPERLLVLHHIRWRWAERRFAVLSRLVAPLYGVPAFVVGAAAVIGACYVVLEDWDQILATVARHWSYGFFLGWILPGCLFVRSARSLAHGLRPKLGSGHVPEVGIAFLYYLLPSIYCDWWTHVVWLRERSQRFRLILAGLYFQLFLWAVGVLGWRLTHPDGFFHELGLCLALSAAVTLLLLSANPLVMMEGYALLLNWLQIPRLRERALAVFGAWICFQSPPEPMRLRERVLFGFFGGLTFIYALVMVSLHLWLAWSWLTAGFEGAGALLTVLVALYLLQRPILDSLGRMRSVRWLVARKATPAAWAVRATLLLAIVGCGLIPCGYHVGGPFELLPASRAVIRSEVEGLVEEVFVREGQWVQAGEPIARVASARHQTELTRAEASLQRARAELAVLEDGAKAETIEHAGVEVATARVRLSYTEGRASRLERLEHAQLISDDEIDGVRRERSLHEGLLQEAIAHLSLVRSGTREETIASKQAEIRRLRAIFDDDGNSVKRATIVSPIAGRIATPRVEELVGTYLMPGERDGVAELVDSRELRAEIQVPEQDAAQIHRGQPVTLVTWAYHTSPLRGQVVEIAPVAAAPGSPPAATELGPETVQIVPVEGEDRTLRVVTTIANPDGRLEPGMTGFAKIDLGSRPLWGILSHRAIRWLRVEAWSWLP